MWSCCEGHFGGRGGRSRPLRVPLHDVLGLGCTSSQKQSLGFSGSLSHLFPPPLYLCSQLSRLLSLSFCFCLRIEAKITPFGGGCAQKRAFLPHRGTRISPGKARGLFGNWCAGSQILAWAFSLSLSTSGWAIGGHGCFSIPLLTMVSPNLFLYPWGHRGNPQISWTCLDLYGT